MRVILFPFKLVVFLVTLPISVIRIPLKLFGFRGTIAFALGFAAGLLVAPRPGAETRRMLEERYRGSPDGPGQDFGVAR